MNKKEEFKTFVSKHPALVNIVRNKTHSWQDLFEVYDLYGEDETLWNNYLSNKDINKAAETSTDSSSDKLSSLTELTRLFKNVNIESVQKYIDTAQKAIGVIQELTGSKASESIISKGPSVARPINKIFED